LIDAHADHWTLGIMLLQRGWISAWLTGAKLVKNQRAVDELLLDTNLSDACKLEALLRLFDPDLPPPALVADPTFFNLGSVDPENPRKRTLKLTNSSRGYLSGT